MPAGEVRRLVLARRLAGEASVLVLQRVLFFPVTVATGLLAPLGAIAVAALVVNAIALWAFVSLGQAALGWMP